MKRSIFTLVVFFYFTISNHLFAKEVGGKYRIQIRVFSKVNKTPLVNSKFIINGDTILSNDSGMVVYELKWRTACAYPNNRRQKREIEKKINSEYISIVYNGCEKKFRNKWRKFGFHNYKKNKKRIYKLTFLF